MYQIFEKTHPPLKSARLEAFAQLLAKHVLDFPPSGLEFSDPLTEFARASLQGGQTVDVRLPDDQLGWWSRIEGVDLTDDALTLVVNRARQLNGDMT